MKNYILHIGLPKTGTTSLQKHYFQALQSEELSFNPHELVRPLIEALKLLDINEFGEQELLLLRKIVKHAETSIPQGKIILSLENLSQRLGCFDYARRAQFLSTLFPEAKVIIVFRYQPDLLRSLYQQFVHQHYLLSPREVFIPFSKSQFAGEQIWKRSMQIDIQEWNYQKTIQCFRKHYGKHFHFMFYENHMHNLQEIGTRIVEIAGLAEPLLSVSSLPRANISFNALTMHSPLVLAKSGLAFRNYSGFNSTHLGNLRIQADNAAYIFKAESPEEFDSRLREQRAIPKCELQGFDKILWNTLRQFNHVSVKLPKYRFPHEIQSYLTREARLLNRELVQISSDEGESVPEQYRA